MRLLTHDRAAFFYSRRFILFVLISNILLSLAVILALASSPWTGLRTTSDGVHGLALLVDEQSPAWRAGIRSGDLLTGINGHPVPAAVFCEFPDYPNSRADIATYWSVRREIAAAARGNRLSVQLERGDERYSVLLATESYPLLRLLAIAGSYFSVAWTFQLLSFLIIRKQQSSTALLNFIASSLVCTMIISAAPFGGRELVFPWLAYRLIYICNYLCNLIFPFTVLHLALVFPYPGELLARFPRLPLALYGFAGAVVALELSGLFDNTLLTAFYPQLICLLAALLVVSGRYLRERNPIRRKQLFWGGTGLFFGVVWLLLVFGQIMPLTGDLLQYSELTILPFLIYPVCLTIAIVRYRLLGVSRLLDQTIVFVSTMVILSGLEFALLWLLISFDWDHVSSDSYLRTILRILMLMLLYVPVRNLVRTGVERLFKRGSYDSVAELRNFMLSLSLHDQTTALEKFVALAERLFGASGCGIIKQRPVSQLLFATDSRLEELAKVIARAGSDFCRPFQSGGGARFGYELTDRGLFRDQGSLSEALMENALFVPFPAGEQTGFCAILLERRDGRAYSTKDKDLLDSLSVSMGAVLEHEELRSARERAEKTIIREKERVSRELHDGISCEFTGIIAYAERAGGDLVPDQGVTDSHEMIVRIQQSARRGLQELRNIIMAIGPETQTLGYFLAYTRRFLNDLLTSRGIDVVISEQCADPDVMLPPNTMLALFRISQEACHNILKHSGADRVMLTLESNWEWLDLTVTDNGCGIHLELLEEGAGLRNMRKRAGNIGGSFQCASPPEGGTVVHIRAPLRQIPNSGDC